MTQFSKNESETMAFYGHIETGSRETLLTELEEKVLPKWKENIKIIKTSSQNKKLPAELLVQNQLLLDYSQLRIQAFELFHKAITENSVLYEPQLEEIHNKIERKLAELQ